MQVPSKDDIYCALCGAAVFNPIYSDDVGPEPEEAEQEYDRALITKKDADWMSDNRILGYNTDSPSIEKYAISVQQA